MIRDVRPYTMKARFWHFGFIWFRVSMGSERNFQVFRAIDHFFPLLSNSISILYLASFATEILSMFERPAIIEDFVIRILESQAR